MKRSVGPKMAIAGILIGATLVSCTASGSNSRPSKYASKAETAIAKGKTEDAIAHAEGAVLADPRNAGYRTLLGQAYMSDGRFRSAARSFEDALELGQNDSRTVISLALAQLAADRPDDAVATLREHRNIVPASDYGLALAMAGKSGEGVQVLSGALRDGYNNPKTRQNLALAYALDGRWKDAKLMATQDVSPDAVDQRIMQWAQIARPGAYSERVASVIGVTPDASDPGQPTRLALSNTPSMAEMAKAIVAPQEKSVAVVVDTPEPTVPSDAASEPEAKPASRPIQLAMAGPIAESNVKVGQIAPAPIENIEVPASKPAHTTAAVQTRDPKPALSSIVPVVVPPKQKSVGRYAVQIGAFSSETNAQRAWGYYSRRHATLNNFDYASSTIEIRGKTLYRLAAIGFEDKSSAYQACRAIKRRGGDCFVRKPADSTDKATTQLASRK